jgi:co-chaperonin GroES (HSP10)|tara:strand:+ start:279 stop:680 length:402 start_codon:yes stop_codon:yes gene_type:complete
MAEPLIDIDHETEDYEGILKEIGDKLPNPKGWKMLIALPKVSSKTEGGIYKPDQAIHMEEIGSIVGLILKMGDLAYKDEDKFPTGPWCEVGDYVIMRSYSGTRMNVGGQEFRLINDDTVEAVISDPRGVMKVV